LERQRGHLEQAEKILLLALVKCTGNGNLVVVELKAHVRLAYLYYEQDDYEKASKEFQAAFDMYRDWMTENV
jgi:tetratricopeptide (TPR) repeat protein